MLVLDRDKARNSDQETFFDPGSMTDPWRAISWKGKELCCARSGVSSCWLCREWETSGTRMGMSEAGGIRMAALRKMSAASGIPTARQEPSPRGIVEGGRVTVLPCFPSILSGSYKLYGDPGRWIDIFPATL
jgi:hypothetical protein